MNVTHCMFLCETQKQKHVQTVLYCYLILAWFNSFGTWGCCVALRLQQLVSVSQTNKHDDKGEKRNNDKKTLPNRIRITTSNGSTLLHVFHVHA